jgi:hypothetical protein
LTSGTRHLVPVVDLALSMEAILVTLRHIRRLNVNVHRYDINLMFICLFN